MNTSKAKTRLVKDIENERRLEYEDDVSVSDGEEVLIYGRRRDSSSGVDWSAKTVARGDESLEIGEEVEYSPGNQQLVLRGIIHVDEGERKPFTFSDVTVEQESPINKCKDDIKHKMIQLWRIGWSDMYLSGGVLCTPDEEFHTSSPLEPVTEEDFKVTTVRADNKAMHLGWSSRDDYEYKLGVNWWSFHNKSNTSLLKTLSHELIHCKHQHHREEFYRDHARFIAEISKSEGRRNRIEALFGDINWDKLKTLTLDGVHDQPHDIDISGHPHRRSACNALVEKLEEILDYRYDVGTTFHTHPPTDSVRPRWRYEYSHDDPNEDYPSRGELLPEGVEQVRLLDLEFDSEYTDEELFEYLQSLKVEEEVGWKYVYDTEDIPLVKDGEVVENPKFAALFERMINDSEVLTEDGFTKDVSIPVRVEDVAQEADSEREIPPCR